jgi:ParB/RepB/Spo0J family partition protein
MMQFEHKIVSIDSIDIENTLFKISTSKPIEDLAFSIRQFGIFAPPIIKSFQSRYIIVSGFHRVSACRRIGRTDIEARVICPEATDLDCLKVAIADNASSRQMNLIEQSNALAKLANFYSAENEFIGSVKDFGFDPNPAYVRKLLALNTLHPKLQQSVLSGAIPMTIAFEIAGFDSKEMHVLIDLFETLKPSLNQQKQILTLLKEISKIRNCNVENILNEKNIHYIISHPDLARPQKIKELKSCLKKIRFPNISLYYDQFNSLVQELRLPNAVKLIPPENFEDMGYSMMLHFDSMQAFESCVEALENLLEKPEFKMIINDNFANQSFLY